MASLPQEVFSPGGATIPCTQVEISVSCRNLADRDTFSKSDPVCVLSVKDLGVAQFHEYGRTEMIKNTLNPEFVKKFILNYFFEESQKLRFDVYDVDSPSQKLDRHDYLGGMECTLGEIVGAARLDKKLLGLANNKGIISIRAEEVSSCKEVVHLQFQGRKLDKKDFFGKSDPFLVFYRSNADRSYTIAHKSEVIKNTLNPDWKPFTVMVRTLCQGNYDMPMKVECYDWNSNGTSHDLIGEFMTSMSQLNEGPGAKNMYEVINLKKKGKKKSYTNSGTITLKSCRIEKQHSFLDFVKGGMQINFTVAVDFTASNGNPQNPESLHYMTAQQPSLYSRALQAVGEIVQDYDSDKMFPALGFGARLPPNGTVSHEFFLNGNPQNPHCAGIDGVLQAYHNTIRAVQLYGPTNFSPVINHVAKFAQAYTDGSNYFVLLILTDGVITDLPQTKQAIVQAARLPMSIIIVGIGSADFTAMDELDGDEKRVSYNGMYAERDIVQFVPFRDFLGGKYGRDLVSSQVYLAKEVLAEIPDQITGYMKQKGFQPKPPQKAPLEPQVSMDQGYGYSTADQPAVQQKPRTQATAPPVSPPPSFNNAQQAPANHAPYGAQPQPPVPYGAQPQPPAPYGAQPQPPVPYGAQQQPPAPYGAQQQPSAPYGGQPAAPYPPHGNSFHGGYPPQPVATGAPQTNFGGYPQQQW